MRETKLTTTLRDNVKTCCCRGFTGYDDVIFDPRASSCWLTFQLKYSVPFEVVAFLEELFSPPWLSLEPPRLHQILTLVSRVPHKNFSALRPKKWAFETEQPSPPLRAPEVGALLKPFRAQQDFSTWFLSMISLWNTIHISVFCLKS